MSVHWEVVARRCGARLGRLKTNHGIVETPAFMPVGTVGPVKAVDATDLIDAGATIMLSNTYHLLLRPGAEMIERRGGLHRFTGCDLPMLTDSGGFQVMSLSDFRKLTEEGVEFKSHLDGRKVFLSPEEAARVQNCLGSDIQMVLDVCPPATADAVEVNAATERSHRWAERALKCPRPEGVLRFGIAQGGFDAERRVESTRFIASMPFDGVAIGGLSVGEPEETMFAMLEATAPHLPDDRPHYLMGVGVASQIRKAVECGVDLFDCVLPTRIARHGTLWTNEGTVRINRAAYAEDDRPVSASCSCLTCRKYSRAYLRHMYRIQEPLYLRLASLHNLTFLLSYMKSLRDALREGREMPPAPPDAEVVPE
jgi:queuine tRNA-ribosyltransferase